MSHLAVQLADYFDTHPECTMLSLEQSAGLKRGTIDSIRRDAHPRPERFGALLRAVDDTTARRWLTAYLRDDCPPEFLPRLEILISPQDGQANTLAETAAPTSTPEAEWQRLHAAIQKDTALGKWFIKTVQLVLGPA